MANTKRTPLEKIQTLETKKVAKLLFYNYITPTLITKILHPEAFKKVKEKNKQGFVTGNIKSCFNEWKEEGFIEKSPVKLPFLVEKKKGKSYFLKNYGYRLTLKPFYQFCNERDNPIEFTKQEKEIINKRIGLESMRKQIFRDYPNDDIINAILKFWIKTFAIPHLEVLNKEHRELLLKIEKVIEKEIEEKNKQDKELLALEKQGKVHKKHKHFILWERENEQMILKSVYEEFIDKKTGKPKVSEKEMEMIAGLEKLKLYIGSYKKNPELISSINKKFKLALGII